MIHAALPPEIWLHIAQCLDDQYIQRREHRLHEVSSVFLQVALDRRYRALKVTDITQQSIHRIERLADPAIACRVRSLTLAPHLNTNRARGGVAGHGAAMTIFGGLVGALLRPSGPTTQQSACVFEDWLRVIIRVLPLLSSLDTFGLYTDTIDPAKLDVQPLVTCAWQSSCAHVTDLRLQASLPGFATLLRTSPYLPHLERLKLTFIHANQPAPDAEDALLAYVAPFVNRHAGRLCALRVHFWTYLLHLDLAPLFKALRPLPALHTFALHAPYTEVVRSDPSGLVRLLCTPTLRTVYLCGNARSTAPVAAEPDPLLVDFVCRLAEEEAALRSVSTLDICAATSPGGLPAFRKLLACLAPTLGTLRVREYDLAPEELQELVGALAGSSSITSLALNIRALCPILFDVLSTALPGLRKLTLNIKDAMFDPVSRAAFRHAMGERRYEEWKLEELEIRNRIDAVTMVSLKKAMPRAVVTSLGTL